MLETAVLQPGTYRLAELAELLGVTRTTIDRYIDRYQIPLTTVVYLNKTVKAVILDEALVHQLQGADLASTPEPAPSPSKSDPANTFEPGVNGSEHLFKQLFELQQALTEEKVARARLEGELKRIEEVIASKQETISGLQATLMLATRHAETKPIEMVPRPADATGGPSIWQRFKGLFGGGST